MSSTSSPTATALALSDLVLGSRNTNLYWRRTPEDTVVFNPLRTFKRTKKRQELINRAMKHFHDNVYMIPLHLQVIPWASRANVNVIHRADNWLEWRWITVK